MLNRRNVITSITAGILALGMGGTAPAQEKLVVVASFSILGDFVANVGGDRVEVATLVGPDGDAHTFQPAPADARAVGKARLIFVNGLGFEGWMPRLVEASGTKGRVVTVTEKVKAAAAEHDEDGGHDHAHAEEGKHDHGDTDPHAWQSVANVKLMVEAIEAALAEADPAGKAEYAANAKAYLGRLDALDTEVKAAVAGIPEGRRRIITSHDAFGYFASAYGVTFLAPQGVSTDAEASAKDVAAIIKQIRAEKVPAVFVENISDPRLIEQITRESGAKIGGTLYSDALSPPDGPAGTYIDMMRHNIKQFASALGS